MDCSVAARSGQLLVYPNNLENTLYVLTAPFNLARGQRLTDHLRYCAQLNIDTEIDWTTYMQQVSLFLSGERDYTLLKGSTGPLVYPAGHVYVYSLLHYLTNQGRDIVLGQILFASLYLFTLSIVMACYRRAGAPPCIFPLLVLSKRLHSVFMLRLFNDAIAATALWGTILLLQRKRWAPAAALWSAGVAIKMTLLLVAPAIGIIVLLAVGLVQGVWIGAVALLVQVWLHFFRI